MLLGKRTILAMSCVLVLGAEELRAQSSFQPYGAWRGHIRSVEGPHGRKEKIRWGGGLTPTGGAVLVQALQSAQTVLTDPNVAGALKRESNEEHRSAFDSQLQSLRSTNSQLRADLNKLLTEKLKIPPVAEVSPLAGVAPAVNPGPAGQQEIGLAGNATKATEEFDLAQKKLSAFLQSMATDAMIPGERGERLITVHRMGNSLLKAMPAPDEKLAKTIQVRQQLIERVLDSFGLPMKNKDEVASTKVTVADYESAVAKLVAEFREYYDDTLTYEKAFNILKAAERLPEEDAKKVNQRIEKLRGRIASWQINSDEVGEAIKAPAAK